MRCKGVIREEAQARQCERACREALSLRHQDAAAVEFQPQRASDFIAL
jgi:hypothetical protein